MPSNLKPRRGKKSTMLGPKSGIVLQSGEMFIELPDEGPGTGPCKMKIGDGVHPYIELQYAFGGDLANQEIAGSIIEDTSENAETALANITTGRSLGAVLGSIRRALDLNRRSIETIETSVNNTFPVGFVFLTIDKDYNPNNHFEGTWQLMVGGYALKTISSGSGGVASAAGKTGSTTLNVNQMPSHTHSQNPHFHNIYVDASFHPRGGGDHENAWAIGGAGIASGTVTETATNNYTGGNQGHNHDAGMPANIGVYAWKRVS